MPRNRVTDRVLWLLVTAYRMGITRAPPCSKNVTAGTEMNVSPNSTRRPDASWASIPVYEEE